MTGKHFPVSFLLAGFVDRTKLLISEMTRDFRIQDLTEFLLNPLLNLGKGKEVDERGSRVASATLG